MSHAHAAIGFGDQDAGETHFGKLLPQIVAETILAIHIPIFAQMRYGGFGFHEVARAVAQHRLVFVIGHGHCNKPLKFKLRHSREGGNPTPAV